LHAFELLQNRLPKHQQQVLHQLFSPKMWHPVLQQQQHPYQSQQQLLLTAAAAAAAVHAPP
jgi:hypothetical protein